MEQSFLISLPRFSTLLSLTDGNSSDQDILLSPTTTATSLIIESNPSLGNALIDEAESRNDGEIEDDAYFERMFDALSRHTGRESNKNNEMDPARLVDFIEQAVGIKGPRNEDKKRRGRAKPRENDIIASACSQSQRRDKKRK